MTAEFFQTKRPWSRYKDLILGYYLVPYIPKVARLGRPILIVDCFAGRGRFYDGEPGSPLIIADTVRPWREKGKDVSVEFIEADPDNFRALETAVTPHADFCKCRQGRFEDHIGELALRAKTVTVFLYIDPYTVKGLVFEKLKAVYSQIYHSRASVEVLMNFNVATFMRWALAALQRCDDILDATVEEADYEADDPTERLEIATLNEIAGGDYWISIASNRSLRFSDKLHAFTQMYVGRMQASFKYVCTYPVKSKYEQKIPKYMLVYATRHSDGLALMNDAMCKAREEFLGVQFEKGRLFDMTPAAEAFDSELLESELITIVRHAGRIQRREVRIETIKTLFCRYKAVDINKAIGDLLKSKKLYSNTGKTRISDDVWLSAQPLQKS